MNKFKIQWFNEGKWEDAIGIPYFDSYDNALKFIFNDPPIIHSKELGHKYRIEKVLD